MKKIIARVIVIIFFLSPYFSVAGTIVLEGYYQGKNIIVQNPVGTKGVGFCVYEVRVNGNLTHDEVNAQTFEIDFTSLQLKIGDHVLVRIKHKNGCKPQILNPMVLLPKSTFEIVTIKSSNNGRAISQACLFCSIATCNVAISSCSLFCVISSMLSGISASLCCRPDNSCCICCTVFSLDSRILSLRPMPIRLSVIVVNRYDYWKIIRSALSF